MTVYKIKGDYYSRQAWMHLGKAREAKRHLRNESDGWTLMVIRGTVRDQAYFARQSLKLAIMYRQIDGRL